MPDWIKGAQPPAAGGPPVYDIVAPAAGEGMSLVVLSTHVLGVEVVWTQDPVTQRQTCKPYRVFDPWPRRELKPRRQHLYFVAVLNRLNKKREILRMGPDSAIGLVKMARKETGVRGLALEVRRAGGRAGLALAYIVDPTYSGPVPEPHDMGPSLSLVMGGYSVDEGNVLPASELLGEIPLPPSEGGAA